MTALHRAGGWRIPLAAALGLVSGLVSTWCLAAINALARKSDVELYAWSAVAIAVLGTTMLASRLVVARLSIAIGCRAQVELLRSVLRLPYQVLESLSESKLQMAFREDIELTSNAVTALPQLAVDLTMVTSIFVYVTWLSPILLGWTVGWVALLALLYWWLDSKTHQAFVAARKHQVEQLDLFTRATAGAKELKLDANRREHLVREMVAATDARRILRHRMYIFMRAFGDGSVALVYLAAGSTAILVASTARVSAAATSSYIVALLALSGPVATATAAFGSIAEGRRATARLRALGLSLVAEPTEPIATTNDPRSVELVGVGHAYESADGPFVVGPIDLTLRPREVVFLIGQNGSGKSTLVKLLTGLYRSDVGEVRLGGERVDAAGLDAFRNRFSAVFSDYALFDNVHGVGDPGELDRRGGALLERLSLGSKLALRGGRFSTLALSSGQRKRVALVQSLLEDRPIYVFDEWAAEQDPRFKRFFYEELLGELRDRGKAVLVVSHDDKYFRCADRIVRMEAGKLLAITAAEATAIVSEQEGRQA